MFPSQHIAALEGVHFQGQVVERLLRQSTENEQFSRILGFQISQGHIINYRWVCWSTSTLFLPFYTL